MTSFIQRWFPPHRLAWIVFGIILAFAAYALIVSFDFGLADNGDFIRVATWFSSGPVGLDGFVANGETTYSIRYFRYWLPYWRLDFPDLPRRFSSIIFLWIPGLAINRLLFSAPVVYLPWLSFTSRLFLFTLPVLIWIASRKIPVPAWKRLLLWIVPGIPYALIVFSGDNLVYLNSLYQESASYIYLILFLACAAIAIFTPSLKAKLATFLSAGLLSLAKPSYFYWMVFGLVIALPWRYLFKRFRTLAIGQTMILLLISLLITILSIHPPGSVDELSQHTTYHSLFNGALAFSSQPNVHLSSLGYPDSAINCVGTIAFIQKGIRCFTRYKDQISYNQTFQVILAEPLITARMWLYASRHMFVTDLGYGRVSEWRDGERLPSILDVWHKVRERVYPQGYGLFATFCVYYVLFGLVVYRQGPGRAIALVGLLTAVACPIDMLVAMMGDGKTDLLKHLFLANLLFDIATVSMLGIVVGGVFDGSARWRIRAV